MAEQLTMDALLDAGLCNYGTPKPGEVRPCSRPATHGARWWKAGHRYYGEDVPDATGGIDCCLQHANYYANAWCPYYPGERTAAWIDVL